MRLLANVLLWANLLIILGIIVSVQWSGLPPIIANNIEAVAYCGYFCFVTSTVAFLLSASESKKESFPLYFSAFVINAIIAIGHYSLYHIFDNGLFG